MLAGPVEATATGNLLLQAVACGRIGSLAEGRRLVATPKRFEPRERDAAGLAAVRERYREIEGAALQDG